MAADVNEVLKGEESLFPRGCDKKEEKEPAPMMVEWGGWGRGNRMILRGGTGSNAYRRYEEYE